MSSKQNYLSLQIFIFISLIIISFSTVLIKVGNEITFECRKNTYYIAVDVIFSGKPQKEHYPFTLYLATPDKLNFKCMLDHPKNQLYCLRAFSDENDFIEQSSYLQFPYPFPELEDIEWDYESFLQKIYRKVLNTKATCGNEDIFNRTDPNYEEWNMEAKISHLENSDCKTAAVTKESLHKYVFDINVSFQTGEIIELLRNEKGKENVDIELLQEIWIPLLPKQESRTNTKTYQRKYPFAYCGSKNKINKSNYGNFTLNCYIPIKTNDIFNGAFRIFDLSN